MVLFFNIRFLVPEVIGNIVKLNHNLLFLVVITALVALAVYLFRFIWVYVLYPLFYLSVSPFQKLMNEEGRTRRKRNHLNEACMRLS